MTTQSPASPQSTEIDDGPVRVERRGAVATVRLHRPEDLGALDRPTRLALLERLREAADDPQVRCVVLTGTGRGFCVGQDLKEHVGLLNSGSQDLGRCVPEEYNPLAELVATMPKPVVAALNGVTAGAGVSLALAADVRILRADAGLNLAFAGIALSCDTGASWLLPRIVGAARAKELLFWPRTIGAEEALALGLVTQVVAPEEFDAAVAAAADRLAAGPTMAYGAIRRAVAYSHGHDLTASLAFEAELMDVTGRSEDHRATVAAFLAKRPPEFTGR